MMQALRAERDAFRAQSRRAGSFRVLRIPRLRSANYTRNSARDASYFINTTNTTPHEMTPLYQSAETCAPQSNRVGLESN